MQEICAESYNDIIIHYFMEICEVLKKNGSLSSQVETPPSSPNAHGRKRRFNKSSANDLVLDFDRFSA